MADDVRLTDLQVIQRYSIAVRGEKAARTDLVDALRADLAWLEGGGRRSPAKRAAPARAAASKPTRRTATASRTATAARTKRAR